MGFDLDVHQRLRFVSDSLWLDSLKVNGALKFLGSLESFGALGINGSLQIRGSLSSFGSLRRFGVLALLGSLLVNGALEIRGSLRIFGALSILGSLISLGALHDYMARSERLVLSWILARSYPLVLSTTTATVLSMHLAGSHVHDLDAQWDMATAAQSRNDADAIRHADATETT